MVKKLGLYFETEKGAFVKNAIVSCGASVVLLGALFKLMHWPGSTIMLIVGMLTEAGLFFMFALLPPHKEYHWEKIYPGLDISPHHDPEWHAMMEAREKAKEQGLDDPLVHQIPGGTTPAVATEGNGAIRDDEAPPAGVSSEIIQNLGKFGESFGNLGDMSDASKTFAERMKGTSQKLSEMNDAAELATEVLGNINDKSGAYKQKVQSLAETLNKLQDMYEEELKLSTEAAEVRQKFQINTDAMLANLKKSTEDTIKFSKEISDLAYNITALNNIYSSWLNDMYTINEEQEVAKKTLMYYIKKGLRKLRIA